MNRTARRRALSGALSGGLRLHILLFRVAFHRRRRVVIGQQIKVETVRGAHRLQLFVGSAGGFGAFAHDVGQQKVPGVFQVLTRSSARSRAPMTRSFNVMRPVLGSREGSRLTTARRRQNGFQSSMAASRKRFFVEELVERRDLIEQLGVFRLAHPILVTQPFLVDGVDLALDASFGGARLFGLLVNGAQAEAEGDAQHDQHGHRDAQTLEAGPRSE